MIDAYTNQCWELNDRDSRGRWTAVKNPRIYQIGLRIERKTWEALRDRAALYSLDSEDSAALTTLPQGAARQVLKADCGRDGTWARVLYAPADAPAQLTGYVRMAQVQLQEAQ